MRHSFGASMTLWSRGKFAAGAFLLIIFGAQLAIAQQVSERFCVVAVLDGAPTPADKGDTWRISQFALKIPGMSAPVFVSPNRSGQWTIDQSPRLVRYDGPFPKSFLDQGSWARESWSSRVVAATYGGGISVLEPGADKFVQIGGPSYFHGGTWYYGVYVLPRRRLTLIIPSNGQPLVADGQTLRPWFTANALRELGIRGVKSVKDAPSLRATIVLDVSGHLRAFNDDDTWSEITSIDDKDTGQVIDTGDPAAVLFEAARSVLAIRRVLDRGSNQFVTTTLATAAFNAGTRIMASLLLHQVLTYDGAWLHVWPRWRRLGPDGWVDMDGGDVGMAFADTGAAGNHHDLPSLRRGVIQGREGLFLYDGARITPVANSGSNRVDKFANIHDLQSIGRVIVTSKQGLFELTADGALLDRGMPFPVEGLFEPAITDWPEAGVAILSTKIGVYVVDRNLNAAPVRGGDQVGFQGWWLAPRPVLSAGATELVLTAKSGLFVVVDTAHTRHNPC
jgi:hypothetical protein